MMMFTTFLILGAFGTSAQAATPSRFTEALDRPIEFRVQEFQRFGAKGQKFLSQQAFSAKVSMTKRWRAITTMGKLSPKAFRFDLDRALRSPEWFMRNAALIAIRSGERKRAIQWSMHLIDDPALVVRTQAVRNLIELDARESQALLWKEVFAARNYRQGESLWVRAHMAEALARFSNKPVRTKDFKRLLLDRDPIVQGWAVVGLENSTGVKGEDGQSLELRRKKWLAKLGVTET